MDISSIEAMIRMVIGEHNDEREPIVALAKKMVDEIARLRAEVEALRVDAERYRYLKDVSAFRAMSLDMSGKHTWTLVGRPIRGEGSTIDAAIDAARGKDNG